MKAGEIVLLSVVRGIRSGLRGRGGGVGVRAALVLVHFLVAEEGHLGLLSAVGQEDAVLREVDSNLSLLEEVDPEHQVRGKVASFEAKHSILVFKFLCYLSIDATYGKAKVMLL